MKSLIKLHSYQYLVGILRTFIAATEQNLMSITNYSFYPKTQYQTLDNLSSANMASAQSPAELLNQFYVATYSYVYISPLEEESVLQGQYLSLIAILLPAIVGNFHYRIKKSNGCCNSHLLILTMLKTITQ